MELLRYFGPLGEPLGFLWFLQVVAAGYLLWRRQWLGGAILAALAALTSLLGATALPKIALASLERPYVRATLANLPESDAIVVLGAGHDLSPRDPFGIELTDAANRIITGVELARQHKAKALVLSGNTMVVNGQTRETAPYLQPWLAAWAVTSMPLYFLNQITNTREEAAQVRALANTNHWKKIILVTSAYHMRRAEAAFKAAGLEVVPAACDFKGIERDERDRFWRPFPEAWRFELWAYYVHEEIGWWLYRLHGYTGSKEEQPTAPATTNTQMLKTEGTLNRRAQSAQRVAVIKDL